MKNRTNRIVLGVVAAGLGLFGAPASASGVRVFTNDRHAGPASHGVCQSFSCGVAGTLSINGRRTTIPAGVAVDAEIVRAFRRAGYDAVCSQGRIVVRFGHRRPSLGWVDRDSGARFSWDRDCLIITTFQNRCNACDACRGPGGHHTGWFVPAPACPPARVDRGPRRDHWGTRWPARRVGWPARGGAGCR